jgi:hypothetical protein
MDPISETRSVYVIGNGPSLNKIDIAKLKSKDTISFNRAFIAYEDWGFFPTYYMVVDAVVLENIKADVKNLVDSSPIRRFFLPESSRDYFGESQKIQYINLVSRPILDLWFWGRRFGKMKIIANVGATSIPVLKILGYENFIILGTDCNYTEANIKNVAIEYNPDNKDRRIVYKSDGDSDPNHFRPDYFGKGTEYSKPQQGNHFRGWEFIAGKMDRNKANIILCSPGSTLVKLFREMDFEEAVNLY